MRCCMSVRIQGFLSPPASGMSTVLDEPHKLKDSTRKMQQAAGSGATLAQLKEQHVSAAGRRAAAAATAPADDEGEAAVGQESQELPEGAAAAGSDGCAYMGKSVLRAIIADMITHFNRLPQAQQFRHVRGAGPPFPHPESTQVEIPVPVPQD